MQRNFGGQSGHVSPPQPVKVGQGEDDSGSIYIGGSRVHRGGSSLPVD